MNELQKVFEYSGVQVRTFIKDGEPWFVAKDICDILELKDPSMALTRLSEKQKGTTTIGTLGGNQSVLSVSEAGLYKLIFTSRKEEAVVFQDWVCEEVLPAIRKTGKYEAPNFLSEMHHSMGIIRSLGWHETATVRKQHVNDNLAKLKTYYHSLIDQDIANEPNLFSVFIQDYCIINQDSKIDRSRLYDGYVRWCIKNNVYPKSKIKLTEYLDELDEVAYLRVDSKNCLNARFMGIELNEEGLSTTIN